MRPTTEAQDDLQLAHGWKMEQQHKLIIIIIIFLPGKTPGGSKITKKTTKLVWK